MATISPTIRSVDPEITIRFLQDAFGFDEGMVHRNDDGTVGHAELWFGEDAVMLGPAGGAATPTASVYVVVDDPDAHHDRAKASGAEITMPLTDQDYGSRDYAAKDPDGNTWFFGTYRPVHPRADGVAAPLDGMKMHVDLVVADVRKSAGFYQELGVVVPELWEEDGVAHHVEIPGSGFGFNSRALTRGYDSSWPDASGVVLIFHVDGRDDVDKRFAELTGSGYTAHMAPIDAFWGARYAIVDDPDGNHVGIMSSSDPREHTSIDIDAGN